MQTPKQLDIAVIGAGVAAAAAAAPTGLNVFLIDSAYRLGGSVVAAMHRSLCGLYSQHPQSPLDTLNAGGQRDLVAQMLALDASAIVPKQAGKTWVLEFPHDVYEEALSKLCAAPTLGLIIGYSLTAIRRESNRITAIQLQSQWVDVKAIIDCTGSGAAMQLAGEDVMHPPDAQRMLGGYSLRLTGITGDAEMLRLQLPYELAKAVIAGQLPPEARFTMFHPGPGLGEGVCKLAIHPDHFTDDQAPRLAEQIISNLRSQIPGFAEVRIAGSSPSALPRDGRRLKGQATVTEDDVLKGRQLGPDAVHAWWPIEHWGLSTGPAYAYPPPGQHYDIPTQALQSATIENLFAAGSCVSATAAAAASLRASGICLATGHAAGVAARSVVDQTVRSQDFRPLAPGV